MLNCDRNTTTCNNTKSVPPGITFRNVQGIASSKINPTHSGARFCFMEWRETFLADAGLAVAANVSFS